MEEGVGQFPSPHRPWTVQASRVNQPPKKTTPKRNNTKKTRDESEKKNGSGSTQKVSPRPRWRPPWRSRYLSPGSKVPHWAVVVLHGSHPTCRHWSLHSKMQRLPVHVSTMRPSHLDPWSIHTSNSSISKSFFSC